MNTTPPQHRPETFHGAFSAERQQRREPFVLLVEDHEDTRTMLNVLLTMYGCRVFEAADGEEGLSMAETIDPDLILLDMKIPIVDGLTVARLLRCHPTLNDVPIIAMTGNAIPKYEAEVLDAGCNYCLIKPFDLQRLEDLVRLLVWPTPVQRRTWKIEHPLAVRARAALAH